MDVWGPARVRGQGHERYFLLVVDDYSRYTTIFHLRSKGEVTEFCVCTPTEAGRGASRCFFRDCTTLTPLAAPVPVSLANPTGGPVVAQASTVLPCPAVPSGSLSGLHLPTFSTNLVSNGAIQDVWVDTFIPGGQRVAICTCSRTGRHLATFTQRPGSSLYTLTTASAQVAEEGQVAASSQVSASGQLAASCSCRVLSHQTPL
ncbi:unnamed protein product [Closterium sp. NIES-54]